MLKSHRALGFDTHVLRLNWDIDWEMNWTPPFYVAKGIRYFLHPVQVTISASRGAVKALVQLIGNCGRGGENRDRVDEPKSARDNALNEYRKILGKTFTDKKHIKRVMKFVTEWTDGV